jgi:prepilin-type N-terminal cleavage/methylation domain-containing protein
MKETGPMNRPHVDLRPGRLRGFTLIEMLVVIVIIALLAGLLLPAITGAYRRARGGAVQAEINQLAQAIASFKTKYGDYFPSRIVLNENGILPSATTSVSTGIADITQLQLSTRTTNAFRKFWPRAPLVVNSSTTVSAVSPAGAWYDFDGNGVDSDALTAPAPFHILEGHECLVFFLGGVPLPDPNNVGKFLGTVGFSKNPVNPFMSGLTTSTLYSANRDQPFFTFDTNRLVTSAFSTTTSASTFSPGFLDQLNSQSGNPQNFYAYFSFNNGLGYDPNDINFNNALAEADGNLQAPLTLSFTAPLTLPSSTPSPPQVTLSPSPNPYTSSQPVPSGTNQSPTYFNAQSFQIISPGVDGTYGLGGHYNATSSTDAPLDGAELSRSNSSDPKVRNLEADNLTNFKNGTLQ